MNKKQLQKKVEKELDRGTVKFGKVSLPVQKEVSPFIPHLLEYSDHDGILETIAYSVTADMPVLLIGETGVGKTAAVRHVAARTRNSLRRVNVNGSTTAEDFVGQLMVNEKGTYWSDGILTDALRNGYWLVIDEINAASAEVLFVLHSLLDDDRYIVLTGKPDKEVVRAHPNFRIFATMNPPERYAGTKDMNKAMLSRFAVTIEVSLPPSSVELDVIAGKSKFLTEKGKAQMKNFLEEVRGAYEKEELDLFVSPRDVRSIVTMLDFTGSMSTAIARTVLPRGTKSEQKAVKDLVRLHFAAPKESPKAEAGVKPALAVGVRVRIVNANEYLTNAAVGPALEKFVSNGHVPRNGDEGTVIAKAAGIAMVRSLDRDKAAEVLVLGYGYGNLEVL